VFGQKVFPFKMLINGQDNELDLVVWMQLDHDLQCLHHVWSLNCVQGWTTKAYHVYDPVYYKVITIAICDI
jgi:hypothetical protein